VTPQPRRIAAWIGALLLVVVAAHGAVWWWVAAEIQRQVAATLAAPPLPGWQASAATTRRGGWPWAATVEVLSPTAQGPLDAATGIAQRWHADRLTVSIALVRPRTLVLAIEGRQEWRLGAGPAIPVTASLLRAEVPLEPGVPARAVTLAVADLRAGLADGEFTLARLDLTGEIRPVAQQGEPALTLTATAARIGLPPRHSAPLGRLVETLALDLLVSGPVPRSPDLAARAEAWRDGGGTLELRRLDLTWGEVSLSGGATLALDARLQPMGAATARIAGHAAALRALTAAGVMTPRSALVAGAVLAPMARRPADGGAARVEMPFSLQNRTLSLGLIPLVRLPELVWRPPG